MKIKKEDSFFHKTKALVHYVNVWESDNQRIRKVTVAGVVSDVNDHGKILLTIGYTVHNPKDVYSKAIGREEAAKRAVDSPTVSAVFPSRKGLIHNFVQLAEATAYLINKTCYQQESAE